MISLNNKYQILTPNGWEDFTGVQKTTKLIMVEVSFIEETAKSIKCSINHPLINSLGNIIKAGDLIGGEFIQHRFLGTATVKEIITHYGEVELYDILDCGREKIFYANDLVNHNCEFIGSTNTLISKEKLNTLTWKRPIAKQRLKFSQFHDGTQVFLDIYEQPNPKNFYVLVADVAGGKEKDYSAFVIIDITTIPYNVVAKWKSNKIPSLVYADVIAQAAEKYNNAFVLVEINDIGREVGLSLHNEIEYENIITTTSRAGGTTIGGGFSKNFEYGLRQNKSTKKVGCDHLKTLIESDKLYINDNDIVRELTQFVSDAKHSFSAEPGAHDDLIMCLVNFAWLVNQRYFKELTGTDIYQQLKKDLMLLEDEDKPFAGFLDNGINDPYDEFSNLKW